MEVRREQLAQPPPMAVKREQLTLRERQARRRVVPRAWLSRQAARSGESESRALLRIQQAAAPFLERLRVPAEPQRLPCAGADPHFPRFALEAERAAAIAPETAPPPEPLSAVAG